MCKGRSEPIDQPRVIRKEFRNAHFRWVSLKKIRHRLDFAFFPGEVGVQIQICDEGFDEDSEIIRRYWVFNFLVVFAKKLRDEELTFRIELLWIVMGTSLKSARPICNPLHNICSSFDGPAKCLKCTLDISWIRGCDDLF